jgi:hypothetical protein
MGTKSTTKVLVNSGGFAAELAAITTSAGAADAQGIPALNAAGVLDPTLLNAKAVSAGAGDAGKPILTNGSGKMDITMLPTGVGADTASILASEALAAGDLVNVYSNGGTGNVRKADAAGKRAHGFVLAAVAQGNMATVYFEGTNDQVTGQVPGDVFLGATPGKAVAAAPTGAGVLCQNIGFAISATAINFQNNNPIIQAA